MSDLSSRSLDRPRVHDAVWFACVIGVIGVTALHIGDLAARNRRSLLSLEAIRAGRSVYTDVAAPVCSDYFGVRTILSDDGIPIEDRLRLAEADLHCLPADRQRLIVLLAAQLYADEGDVRQACSRMQSVGAASQIVLQADKALAAKDYPTLEAYLRCLESAGTGATHAPRWETAWLYEQLGAHFDVTGDSVKAMDAYLKAIALEPQISFRAYLATGRLMATQGQRAEAVQFLVSAAVNPMLANMRGFQFLAWRDIGFLLEEEGRMIEAGCAYAKALAGAQDLPAELSPPGWREELEDRERSIAKPSGLDTEQCLQPLISESRVVQ